MAISTGVGKFNVGRDCQVVITHALAPNGRVDLTNLMTFDCKQVTANIKIDRLDGVQLNAELPKGWTITIENERGDAVVDDFFAAVEAAWYSGGNYVMATIYQYITETNGAQTTYQFDNVALKFDNPGSWKGDASVKQSISGTCNRRRKV